MTKQRVLFEFVLKDPKGMETHNFFTRPSHHTLNVCIIMRLLPCQNRATTIPALVSAEERSHSGSAPTSLTIVVTPLISTHDMVVVEKHFTCLLIVV